MNKLRVLVHQIHYPFTLGHYFIRALERRNDVELCTVGAYTGARTPWNGGMNLPMKYVRNVDIPLPPSLVQPSYDAIQPMLPWTPDLVLEIDAGAHFAYKKPPVLTAVVGTDPHVLNEWYDQVRPNTDYFFNMQHCYMRPGDIFLPYACDPFCHYPDASCEETVDACLVGLHYPQRNEWVAKLQQKGYTINYTLGLIYDEYRQANCSARVGLNWSSLQDVNARFYELSAMKCRQVCNILPDMELTGWKNMEHYMGFHDMNEAVEMVEWALTHLDESRQIAINAYNHVLATATYDMRVQQILETVGLV